MSLRLRLTLAFLAIASLLAAVALLSIGFQREINFQVAQVEESSIIEVAKATEMALALLRCTTAAEDYLVEKYRALRGAEETGRTSGRDPESAEEVRSKLERALADFGRALAESRKANAIAVRMAEKAGAEEFAAFEREEAARYLDAIGRDFQVFGEDLARFLVLAEKDPDLAHDFLDEEIEPSFRRGLLRMIEDYRDDTTAELSQEAHRISAEATNGVRLLVATSVFALLLALLLSSAVARSIINPILALKNAALEIGQGNLDTRVALRSRDELGLLGQTLDEMAERLGRTTVSLAEKEALLREVHHRVKNNLQVVSSLLDLQASYLADPERRLFAESQRRIRSMALIHEQLYRTADAGRIDFRDYLDRLAEQVFRSYGADPAGIALHTEEEPLLLDLDRAVACGLVVNELVSNALKHAFPQGAVGQVRIDFRREGDNYLLLVADDGRGFGEGVEATSTATMGMSLVATLVRQLHGRLTWRGEGGTECRVEFPREAPVEGAADGR